MIRVSKTRLGSRPGFVALWRVKKKKFCRGIGTADEVRADEIIATIQRILNTALLLNPDHPDHYTTPREAYRAVFQREPPEPPDTATVEIAAGDPQPILVMTPEGSVASVGMRQPATRLVRVRMREMKELRLEAAQWKKRALLAESKNDTLQTENLRLVKSLNRHCTVTLAEGMKDFERQKKDVSQKSLDTYLAALKDLRIYLGAGKLQLSYKVLQKAPKSANATRADDVGGACKIAELRGKHFDDFLAARLDKKTETAITEKRKAALKRELSVPYHFWVRRYELAYDAFAHTQLLTGHKATAPDSREMIRTVADLKNLLWALGKEETHGLYWQAFVGTAALSGADLSSLFDLTPQDVIFEEPVRFIMCRNKTGYQRDTPIERTILLSSLAKYCKALDPKQAFLFPSLLGKGSRARTLTAPGRWSGASAFGDAWEDVSTRCARRIQKKHKLSEAETAYCLLGPRAWRRSAMTFMTGAGCLPGQVARWLGHSVQIADRYYLGRVERNELQFESQTR